MDMNFTGRCPLMSILSIFIVMNCTWQLKLMVIPMTIISIMMKPDKRDLKVWGLLLSDLMIKM